MNTTAVVQSVVIGGSLLIALGMVVGSWQLAATRKAKATVTSGKEYRGLADEYRRLSELAVTAQEHTDLKLGEINMQMGQLRNQLERVQKILEDVE